MTDPILEKKKEKKWQRGKGDWWLIPAGQYSSHSHQALKRQGAKSHGV